MSKPLTVNVNVLPSPPSPLGATPTAATATAKSTYDLESTVIPIECFCTVCAPHLHQWVIPATQTDALAKSYPPYVPPQHTRPTNASGCIDKSKYKTRLCDRFMKDGNCEFGSRCIFAHGFSELRSNVVAADGGLYSSHTYSGTNEAIAPWDVTFYGYLLPSQRVSVRFPLLDPTAAPQPTQDCLPANAQQRMTYPAYPTPPPLTLTQNYAPVMPMPQVPTRAPMPSPPSSYYCMGGAQTSEMCTCPECMPQYTR